MYKEGKIVWDSFFMHVTNTYASVDERKAGENDYFTWRKGVSTKKMKKRLNVSLA